MVFKVKAVILILVDSLSGLGHIVVGGVGDIKGLGGPGDIGGAADVAEGCFGSCGAIRLVV